MCIMNHGPCMYEDTTRRNGNDLGPSDDDDDNLGLRFTIANCAGLICERLRIAIHCRAPSWKNAGAAAFDRRKIRERAILNSSSAFDVQCWAALVWKLSQKKRKKSDRRNWDSCRCILQNLFDFFARRWIPSGDIRKWSLLPIVKLLTRIISLWAAWFISAVRGNEAWSRVYNILYMFLQRSRWKETLAVRALSDEFEFE